MATPRSQGAPDVPPAFATEIASFRRHLRAENKSDNTVRIYTDAAERFAKWLEAGGDLDRDPAACWDDVEPSDVQAWIVSLLDTRSAGYANNQYRSIQQFFRWWSDEEQLPNPMAGMSPPAVPEQPVPVLTEEQLGALLKDCQGRDFVARRDLAIFYMFMDAGVRRAEIAGMLVEDLDLDMREARVRGKGRRDRTVTYGRKAAVALDRYVRERGRQKWADSPRLWLAEKNRGTLGTSGIYLMLKRRGRAAGIPELHPHMLRHSWAHYMKKSGESEENLMRLAGWRSHQMVARYAASVADERARESSKSRALGDRL